ncbi:Uncharacterised protein [Enterococcus faecium]|uniref:Uncharacterized protein n=1 Tax=Enterococcus faecium TaxID=1352 RepID=A0A6N3FMR6_ENTFC|nr:hypothetical protein [Enterococcus sp. T0168A.B-11]TXU27617.1 hypothetical protein D4M94_03125 [Enterococcus sp. T0168A.B-11]
MFTFYWLFQKNDNWLAIFKTDDRITTATDKESLEQALSSVHYLVSYGNYQTSDKFLAKILSDGKSSFLQKYLSIDLSQEARNCTIEEIGFNLRMKIKAKTPEEFCLQRIAICEAIFSEREEYLETKFEIVKEFQLKPRSIMKTRANLAAEILQAKKMPKRPNILLFEFDQYVPFNELPERLVHFYQSIKDRYKNTLEEKLKQEKFKMTLANLTHTFGVGGVHAAKEKYRGEGCFLLIDVNQFFPSIIQNNKLLSVGIKCPEIFDELYKKKVQTGKLAYKILINAINGSMNNPYSALYDPQKFYSVTVNGQLIITHLILVLESFFEELIQTNTDGILIRINPVMENTIRDLLELWCRQLHLQVSITKVNKVWQKDVNNYVLQKEDGQLVRKGIFAKPTYLSNSTPVIYNGIFEAVVNGIKPQNFIIDQYKKESLEEFCFIGKIQGDFTGIEQQTINGYVKLNKTICGIAANSNKYGGVFQVRNDLHSRLPNSPSSFLTYEKATKKDIDTKWYIEQIEKNCF